MLEGLRVGDELKIIGRTTGVYSLTVSELRDVEQAPITEAKKGDVVTIPVTETCPKKTTVCTCGKIEHYRLISSVWE
jgi:hypothetical protein